MLYKMEQRFVMKNLGFPHLFLGMQIIRGTEGWLLRQSHYAEQLLEKAQLENCKPCSTPIVPQPPDSMEETPFKYVTLYRSLCGSFLYFTLTRPDISYAVNWICQFMHAPLMSHFAALKRILRYVSGSLNCGLLFQPGSLEVCGYSDSDWAGDKADRKSTTGYCVFLGPNLITWCAKKQPTIARSSTEAEYKALANTAAEIMWLIQLLKDLQNEPTTTPLILCDNMSALALANNPVFHARTKHVEVDYHFVREKIQQKILAVDYIPSEHQLADLFTKPLHYPQFQHLKIQFPILSLSPRCSPRGKHLEGGCQDEVLSLDVKAAENSATIAKDKTDTAVEGGATRGWSSAQGDLQYNLKVLEGIGGNGAYAAATDQQQLMKLADSAGKNGGMRDLFSAELDIQGINEVSQGDMEEAHVKGSVLA